MGLRELSKKGRELAETGDELAARRAEIGKKLTGLQAQCSVVRELYFEASDTDEDGNYTGNATHWRGELDRLIFQIQQMESEEQQCLRQIEEINEQKKETISGIEQLNHAEEGNLEKLRGLMGMMHSENAKALIADLISRMNQGEETKDQLLVSLGEGAEGKRYSDAGAGGFDGKDASNQKFVADTLDKIDKGLSGYIDKEMVLASAEERKLNTPKESSCEQAKGTWEGNVFCLDDDYVPVKFNDKKLTVAEIKKTLRVEYGISFDGSIPFTNGAADFRSVSVASISVRDIVMREKKISAEEYDRMEPAERTRLFAEIFQKEKREHNFDIADAIAAERQLKIPGLPAGYTKEELKKWRKDHDFSWDEQVESGYNLVPAIIHGNISHTGLVGSAEKAARYIDRRKEEAERSPEKYSWDETKAPVSIEEVLAKKD